MELTVQDRRAEVGDGLDRILSFQEIRVRVPVRSLEVERYVVVRIGYDRQVWTAFA